MTLCWFSWTKHRDVLVRLLDEMIGASLTVFQCSISSLSSNVAVCWPFWQQLSSVQAEFLDTSNEQRLNVHVASE